MPPAAAAAAVGQPAACISWAAGAEMPARAIACRLACTLVLAWVCASDAATAAVVGMVNPFGATTPLTVAAGPSSGSVDGCISMRLAFGLWRAECPCWLRRGGGIYPLLAVVAASAIAIVQLNLTLVFTPWQRRSGRLLLLQPVATCFSALIELCGRVAARL